MQPDLQPQLAFCLRLDRAATSVRRRLDGALGNHHGISFADYQLLAELGHAPGGRLRRIDLAGQLGLTASGVTRSLLPLEKIGLVERQSDPRDARVGYALLSNAGRALLADAGTTVQLAAADAVAAIDNAALPALEAALGRLVHD